MGTGGRAAVALGSIAVAFIVLLAFMGSTVGIYFDGTLYVGLVGAWATVGVGVAAALSGVVVAAVIGLVTYWVMKGGE